MPFLKNIVSLLQPNVQYVLAFSGGLDSTVLLHQLIYYQNNQVRALHVHHGLSANADKWAIHCQKICQQWNISCDVLYVNLDKNANNIEATARDARYQILFQQLKPNECLLTAQHLDDQCETLLLALKRGSGPAGLSAMPLKKWTNGHLHIRPLLNFSRQQLKYYALENKLSWIEDESNQNIRYDRNFLRLHILPLLQSRWEKFNVNVTRSATICAQQEQLLNELLIKELEQLTDEQGALYFPTLLTMSESYCNAILRRWIAKQGGKMPSFKALKIITSEIIHSRKDAQPLLRFSKYQVRRYRNKLYYLPLLTSLSEYKIIWDNRNLPLLLPENLGQLHADNNFVHVRHPTSNEKIIICFKAPGYCHTLEHTGGRKIKKIWQELGIPPWQRKRIPLVFYNDKLISAPQLFVTHEGKTKNGKGWTIIWTRKIINTHDVN